MQTQLEHFHHMPQWKHTPTKRMMHHTVLLRLAHLNAAADKFNHSFDAFVLVQRRWELWTWPAEQSLTKSCYARDPWKGDSMSDIWSQHAVLQPSSASVWSPEYHCQLGSNLHWAWESGTLTVSLMVSSPLLHWFQLSRYSKPFIPPAWHPLRQIQRHTLLYLYYVWKKNPDKYSAWGKFQNIDSKFFNINGITLDVV